MLVNNNSSRFRSALGESLEDYLEAILLLGAQKRPVRVKDIAHFLGVSRPSVVNALNQLKNKGLVRHEHYGDVELTIRGRTMPRQFTSAITFSNSFYIRSLGSAPGLPRRTLVV